MDLAWVQSPQSCQLFLPRTGLCQQCTQDCTICNVGHLWQWPCTILQAYFNVLHHCIIDVDAPGYIVSLHADIWLACYLFTLQNPDGNVSRVLRGEMPELAGAGDKSKSKQGCQLIYKRRSTLKGNDPPNQGQDPWHSSP